MEGRKTGLKLNFHSIYSAYYPQKYIFAESCLEWEVQLIGNWYVLSIKKAQESLLYVFKSFGCDVLLYLFVSS